MRLQQQSEIGQSVKVLQPDNSGNYQSFPVTPSAEVELRNHTATDTQNFDGYQGEKDLIRDSLSIFQDRVLWLRSSERHCALIGQEGQNCGSHGAVGAEGVHDVAESGYEAELDHDALI